MERKSRSSPPIKQNVFPNSNRAYFKIAIVFSFSIRCITNTTTNIFFCYFSAFRVNHFLSPFTRIHYSLAYTLYTLLPVYNSPVFYNEHFRYPSVRVSQLAYSCTYDLQYLPRCLTTIQYLVLPFT